jgi:ABC-type protease/lipase transport system, ATPase and permease components
LTGAVSETALDALKRQLKPVMIHIGAVSFFINLLVLPVSLYSLQVLDRVMATGSMSTLFWLTLIMIVLFAASAALQYLRSTMLQRVGDWGYEKISLALLPITLHTATVNSKGSSQALRDANILKQFLSGAAIATIMDAPWTVLYLAVLFIVHSVLGVLVTAGVIALFILAWLNESMMRLPLKHAGSHQLKGYQDIEFATRNADVIEAMGMRDTLIARWHGVQSKVNEWQGQATGRSAVIQGVTKFIRLTLQILVTGDVSRVSTLSRHHRYRTLCVCWLVVNWLFDRRPLVLRCPAFLLLACLLVLNLMGIRLWWRFVVLLLLVPCVRMYCWMSIVFVCAVVCGW